MELCQMQSSLFNNECRVVNLKDEPYDVYIGRGSKWGNPFPMVNNNRDEVCDRYANWFFGQPHLVSSLHELVGKRIGCYCKPKRCHGDFLVRQVRKYLETHDV